MGESLDNIARYISDGPAGTQHAKQIYGILSLIGKRSAIIEFKNSEISGEHLPFEFNEADGKFELRPKSNLATHVARPIFHDWTQVKKENFYNHLMLF